MAYVDQSNDPRRRATAVAGVALVHAAIGLGIVMGLTVVGVAPVPKVWNPFPERPEPTPTPQPPEPQQTERKNSETIVAPLPPITPPLPKDDDVVTIDKPVDTSAGGTGPTVMPTPSPMPSPTLQPRLAKPANDRNGWITNDDYPAALLRREVEGTVEYRLIVGSNGRVSACEVTRSSGNGQLDDATCRLIQRRARFEAATDEAGAKVLGSFTGTVRWQIPD